MTRRTSAKAGSTRGREGLGVGGWGDRMAIQSSRDLEVWKLALDLAVECYRITKTFPKDELFGLTSQIRRAAASVPANIAEGHGRDHTKEFLYHLSIARGSLMELQTHLLLANRISLLPQSDVEELLRLSDSISKMISRLRQSLQKRL
ncbi:MAG: four helix bundle protein [Planctomycetaceae bacterium]